MQGILLIIAEVKISKGPAVQNDCPVRYSVDDPVHLLLIPFLFLTLQTRSQVFPPSPSNSVHESVGILGRDGTRKYE